MSKDNCLSTPSATYLSANGHPFLFDMVQDKANGHPFPCLYRKLYQILSLLSILK